MPSQIIPSQEPSQMKGDTLTAAPSTAVCPLERQDIVNIVRRWADVNTDGILDASCQLFSSSSIEGLIGYRIEASNAVVFGDPVCPEEHKGTLAQEFQAYCKNKNLGVVYAVASEEFAKWAVANIQSVAVEFGEKFVLNPLSNPMNNKGSKAGLVRKKVKHALAEGVFVEEYRGNDPEMEAAIQGVADAWLDSRHGPQVYLANISLFKDRTGKRWLYAKQAGHLVGILLLNQLKANEGWLLNNVMITKNAPNGLSELLVISALQMLEIENCQHVIIGPVPAKRLGKIEGLGRFATTLTRWAYKGAQKVFRLGGHEVFWEKFQPAVKPAFLLFPENNLSISSIKALLRAFNVHI